jgi:hypothetical protein
MNFYKFLEIIKESRSAGLHGKDPVRNAVANIDNYWSKPGLALSTIQSILHDHGYMIPYASFDVHDKSPEHTQRFDIHKIINPQDPNSETEDTNSSLIFSWHWMPSGEQVEITAYLS